MVNRKILDIIAKSPDKKSDEGAMINLLLGKGLKSSEVYEAIKYAKDNGIMPSYQPKEAGSYSGLSGERKLSGGMKFVAIFFLVTGIIATVIGLLGLTVDLSQLISTVGMTENAEILEKATGIVRVIGAVILPIGAFSLLTSWGVWNQKRWGKTLAIIASVFMFFLSIWAFVFAGAIIFIIATDGKDLGWKEEK